MKFTLSQFIALLLAVNYFSFQVEFDEEEYLQHHRPMWHTLSLDKPTLNWETFDKTNAPKAFVLTAEITFTLLHILPIQVPPSPFVSFQPTIIRDKSPPYTRHS
jgi:hypothetical protein